MCDLDEPRIWEEQTIAARKPHRCDDCGELIVKGELHVRADALYADAGWSHFRLHSECMSWRRAHLEWERTVMHHACGAPMGNLLEALDEAQHEIAAIAREQARRRPSLYLVEATHAQG